MYLDENKKVLFVIGMEHKLERLVQQATNIDPKNMLILKSYTTRDFNKGIKKPSDVKEAINRCASVSENGLAHVETDMRAHMNPTRMKVISELGVITSNYWCSVLE
jgi:hypothetical protein